MKKLVTLLLCLAIIALPLRADDNPPPPPQEVWLAVCLLAAAGAAAAGIYIVARTCAPKYYCHKDDSEPPVYWVGTSTAKECELKGWKRLSGPYASPGDCVECPPGVMATNVVQGYPLPPISISVWESTNLTDWVRVHQEVCDPEDFVYWPTNKAAAAFYKLSTP